MSTPPPSTRPSLAQRRKRDARWRIAGNIGFVVFGLAFVTVTFLAVQGTELVDSVGHTLDCGSVLVPSTSPFAAENCAGVNDGNVIAIAVLGAVALAGLAVGIVRIVRASRWPHA
jgi:hypothetical protein